MRWLTDGFVPPCRVDLQTGEHLRPITEADVEIDYPAVMGSRERLWEKYGTAWGWPPSNMSFEDDRRDLARHQQENETHEAFNYAVLSADESTLFGCVYIDPPDRAAGCEAIVSWWVIDDAVGSELERYLETFVPSWLAESWPFSNVDYHP